MSMLWATRIEIPDGVVRMNFWCREPSSSSGRIRDTIPVPCTSTPLRRSSKSARTGSPAPDPAVAEGDATTAAGPPGIPPRPSTSTASATRATATTTVVHRALRVTAPA